MADIHVLTGNGSQWQVLMHLPIPNAENAVGVNYRLALVNSGLGGTSAMTEGDGYGQITAAELIQINNGELYEHPLQFQVEGNGADLGAIRDALRAAYARELSLTIAALQERLRYYGHTESQA